VVGADIEHLMIVSLVVMDGESSRHGWCPHQPSIDVMHGVPGRHGWCPHQPSIDVIYGAPGRHGWCPHQPSSVELIFTNLYCHFMAWDVTFEAQK